MTDAQGPMTLSELAVIVGGSWRTLVAGSIAGILVGLCVHLALPQTYSATASVRVDATGVDPLAQPQPQPVDIATEERVAASRGGVGADEVEVHAVPDSSVLRITHTAPTARGAALGANQVARGYLADRARHAAAELARVRAVLDRQARELPDDTAGPRAQELVSELARARRLRTGGGAIIDAARPPARGNRPGLPISCLAGVLAGLLVATPLTMLRSRPSPAAQLVLLDADSTAAAEIRRGVAALADHVLVVRQGEEDLRMAELWCDHLRSVGISASVVRVGPT